MFSVTIRLTIDDSNVPGDASLKEIVEAIRMFAEAVLTYYGVQGKVEVLNETFASGPIPEGWRVK